jgi:hypothetical protein
MVKTCLVEVTDTLVKEKDKGKQIKKLKDNFNTKMTRNIGVFDQ